MGSEDLAKKARRERRQRKIDIRKQAPYRYLIVCEGEKTEPHYFEGIKRYIDEKYVDKIKVEQKPILEIKGTGRNTNDLVNFVEHLKNVANIPYGHIWVIFDKDDFSDGQFNSAIDQAFKNGYEVGWSNEAIELWFVLHFEYLTSAINRNQYCNKLSLYFKKCNIADGKYNKSMIKDIFELLVNYGDVNKAIERSINLIKMHEDQGNSNSAAKMKPATTVYKLVKELLDDFS